MKFNEQLLKNRISENLNDVKNDLDRESKTDAIVEALNFFDNKRDWVEKITREDITSLITNSKDQEALCESILEKVNNTPFTKALKESKKKKEVKQKLNESLTKQPLKEEKLNEGTSNFYDHNYLPLLVFITDEELEDAMYNDSDCPTYDDFEDEDDFYNALDSFRDEFYDNYYKGVGVLTEEQVDDLEFDLNNFNSETKEIAYELDIDENGYQMYGENLNLEDIMLKVEPGYYEGGQIYCEHEKYFDSLSEDVKKEQLERFNTFLDEMQEEYGLTKLKTAYRMSNGETGYTIVEELKNLNEGVNTNELADFILKNVNEGLDFDGLAYYELDDDLAVSIGWLEGYDPKDAEFGDIVTEDGYGLNVAITENPSWYAYVDFDYLNQPYDEETGDVWDTMTTLSSKDANDGCKSLADWLIEQYEEIRHALDKGELVLNENHYYENLNEVKGQDKYFTPKGLKAIEISKKYGLYDYYDSMGGYYEIPKSEYEKVKDKVKELLDNNKNYELIDGDTTNVPDYKEFMFVSEIDENLKEDWVKRYRNFSYYPHEDKADTFIVVNEKDKTRKEICATSYDDAKKYIKDVLIKKPIKEANDDLQTVATKMMSVKKYYIDMAWKNGKTWKTEPMTLKEIGDSVDAKVTEQQFVDMMSDNIKNRKDAKNLTKAEIVKVYDYMDGQWQGKDVLWSINDKTNESLNENEIDNRNPELERLIKFLVDEGIGNYTSTWLAPNKVKLIDEYSDNNSFIATITDDKLSFTDLDGKEVNSWKNVDEYKKEYFDLNESLKENKLQEKNEYFSYMDKEYAELLDSNVDVYDIDKFILSESNNELKAHYTGKYAIIICANGKGCVVDYEAVGQDFNNIDSEISFGAVANKDNEYVDDKGVRHKTISVIATHEVTTTPKEVMEKAPKETMKYRDFFTKYDYNDRCAANFKSLAGYIEENNGIQEGCHSKKKGKKLKEGYIGQTLEDFFEDCIDPDTIGQVNLWGDGDEPIYDGDYDGAINEFGDNEFIEFDCGMDKVVINVDTSLDTQVTTYFVDVQDFIEFFNGDEIEVYDVETGETLFSGDKYDLPDDVAEKIFVSFDAPKFISINIEEDGSSDDYDDFDDEEDSDNFDENLNEALGKIQEVTKAIDCDGNEFSVKPIWKTDRLATLVDKDGNQTKVEIADLRQYYDLYDQDNEVISKFETYNESLNEDKSNNWENYGDVNFLTYGGELIRKLDNGSYQVISLRTPWWGLNDGEYIIGELTIDPTMFDGEDINEREKMKNYSGVGKNDEYIDEDYICDLISYYGIYELGGQEAKVDKGGVIQTLKDYGVNIDTLGEFDESLKEDVQNINAKIYYEEDGEPIIVFKSIGDREGNFDAYVHNGQHTVAAPDYVKTLKKANINDQKVKDLIAEYESNYPVKLNLKEDTVKQDGKWVNKGNTGKTHGEFKTKKEADKQRAAMFAGRKPNAKWGK